MNPYPCYRCGKHGYYDGANYCPKCQEHENDKLKGKMLIVLFVLLVMVAFFAVFLFI